MKVRKKRRLGLISDADKRLIHEAEDAAMTECAKAFKQGQPHYGTCIRGVSAFRYELQKRGLR